MVLSATNGPVTEAITAPLPLDDDYRYFLSGNWIDDQRHSHIGVRVETPEIPPEW